MIYFDNASSTEVYPEILDLYNKINKKYYGNPSSIHTFGQESGDLFEKAKSQILSSFGLKNYRVIFTSGATEANNLALFGYCLFRKKGHIIVGANEHASILECAKVLSSYFGFEVTYIDPKADGVIDIDDIKNSLRKDTILVSIMGVNNEVGAINPIKEIRDLLKDYPRIVFHSDMAQGVGKYSFPFNEIDMFTVSSHKIHGLKGAGALIIKKNIVLKPLINGGHQQDNFRSGTIDLASCICLTSSVRHILSKQEENYKKVCFLNKTLRQFFSSMEDDFSINSNEDCSPYIFSISSLNKKASVIVEALSKAGIMVSSVSACSSKKEPISYVLLSMKKSEVIARNSIRISFSEYNSEEEIMIFIETMKDILKGIR